MAALTIRPWAFPEDQQAELFWFGSPFIDYKGNWRIRVAFRSISNQLKIISYPWGTMPNLRIGQIYTNGVYDQIKPLSGSAFTFTINNLSQHEVVTGFQLPKRLIDFGKNPEFGLQNIVQYHDRSLIFCIPVIELIRAMFINSRTLAIYLLQPHGLELLIDRSEAYGKTLHFDMSSRIPVKQATESNARHLSWIVTDEKIRSVWDSVYRLLFSQAIKDSPQNSNTKLKKGIPFQVELPDLGPIEMQVRGEKFMSYVLVKEILAFSGFKHPYEDILFWHPSKKQHESVYGDKQVRLTPRGDNHDYILNDDSENAKEDIHQDVLETAPTFMKFSNSPVVRTRRRDVRRSNTGNEVVVLSGRGGKNAGVPNVVSTQDSIVGGDTPPIEFQTLETIPVTEAIGLEPFFKMLQILKETFPARINLSVLRIPPGKRFSICPDGSRRTCAIVQITRGYSTSYLVEVARPDDWSISTLILRPKEKSSPNSIEQNIKLLLDGLVQKSGHWDQHVLNLCGNMSVEKVKHFQSDSLRDWAYRIFEKINNH